MQRKAHHSIILNLLPSANVATFFKNYFLNILCSLLCSFEPRCFLASGFRNVSTGL